MAPAIAVSGLEALMLTLAVVLVVIGLAVGVESRLKRRRWRIRLAGVGELSAVTHTVIALACLGAGYHLAMHALRIGGMVAPLGIALGVAALAVLGSIGIDALDVLLKKTPEDRDPHHPGAAAAREVLQRAPQRGGRRRLRTRPRRA
ncbi:MAG: hypothetical protein VYC34_01425, partial [Planctomycetota bacterium]|nr:hypothetical protein [Planctomycetota bacterium]